MTDIRYLRGYNGSPYTVDLWDGALQSVLNLYGMRFNYADNPMIDAVKPMKIGHDGYVTTGLIDMLTEVAVSGNINWAGYSIVNLADAVSAASPVTLQQLNAAVINANNELDYVSGVLQSQIDAIVNDQAWEYTEVVASVSGQTIFDVTPHVFNSSNSRVDIQVFRNTGRIFQTIDFIKLDDHRIQTNDIVPQNSRITVREERTGGTGGGGGGGTTDLTNIDVNPQPDTDGLRSLGGTKAWRELILRDLVTGDHYQLAVSGGMLLATLV